MKIIYGIDLRSIAAFRIILSLFIALEFAFMVFGNFSDIYSPETGILGNAFAQDFHSFYKGFIGIFFIHSDIAMKLFICLIIAVMLMLCIGFYPRIMAFTGCVLLYLFFNRYSLLYVGWEMYASVMLFWLAFMPSASFFSFFTSDSYGIGKTTTYHKTQNPEPRTQNSQLLTPNSKVWNSPLAFALIFQIGMIYFYNGISKNGELWMTGRAVECFFYQADKARPLTAWLLQFNSNVSSSGVENIAVFSVFFTYFILILEIGLIFILFVPFKNKQFRYLASFLIFSLHWGIDIFVDVGNFKYVATAVAILLLPGDFWNSLVRLLYPTRGEGHQPPLTPPNEQSHLVKKPSHIFRQAQYDSRAVSQSLSKTLGRGCFLKYPLTKRHCPERVGLILAYTLCFFIIFSNLSQTNASKTTDRMKHVIDFLHFDKILKKVNHHLLPQYSFFTQYWHLYSPDPPQENGYMQVEVITDNNDTLSVFNGIPLEKKLFYSTVQHNLFTYLLLKKGRNQKDKIAEKYLVLREIRLWNKQPENAKLRSVQLVIYSRLFDKNVKIQSGFERVAYKTIDVKYR